MLYFSYIATMDKQQLLLSSSRKSIDRESSSPSRLHDLLERIQRIGSCINMDSAAKTLRLMQGTKLGGHFREDPHTLLRNLQNRSEINRAEVELMSQRRPKHYSSRPHNQRQNDQQDSYLSIYRRIQHEIPVRTKQDTEITSEEEWAQEQIVNGVRHFSQLKHHPRLLQYTLDRMRLKASQQQQEDAKLEGKQQIKTSFKPNTLLDLQYQQIKEQQKVASSHLLQTPKAIVDNQLTKFYSKSSKGKLEVRVKENPRCARLLQRQGQLVSRLEDGMVSKENIKKLKQRLNVIVNDIASTDRYATPERLPKIDGKT